MIAYFAGENNSTLWKLGILLMSILSHNLYSEYSSELTEVVSRHLLINSLDEWCIYVWPSLMIALIKWLRFWTFESKY